jgi:Transposase DDE domain
MTAEHIIGIYVVIDDTMRALGHSSHRLAGASDAEVLTVAVVAAAFCGNHHAHALAVLRATGYLARALSSSRFSRRLHRLADWLVLLLAVLGALFAHGQAAICDFVIDSMPIPVCKRVRARRCRTVRGRAFCGYCAAKKEKFFGWRLHLVCTTAGLPVACTLLPGGWHDLTPVHELTVELPAGAWVYGDKAYNSTPDEAVIRTTGGGVLVPLHKDNMAPNTRAEQCGLRTFRLVIETVNSQLAAMGLNHLHVRSVAGLQIKVHASLLALACLNLA